MTIFRRWIARLVAAAVVVSAGAAWIAGEEPPAREAWRLDRLLRTGVDHDGRSLGEPWGDRERRAILYARNGHGSDLWYAFLGAVDEVRETSGTEAVVQARGLPRSLLWVLHYHVYPRRVVGEPLEAKSRPSDPVLPEADWVLTLGARLHLERRP